MLSLKEQMQCKVIDGKNQGYIRFRARERSLKSFPVFFRTEQCIHNQEDIRPKIIEDFLHV